MKKQQVKPKLSETYDTRIPRVVGTILTRETLFGPVEHISNACDIAELRLDGMSPAADCLERACEIESNWQPLLLTVRLERDGGGWADKKEADRGKLLEQGLSSLSCIDIEIQSTLRLDLCQQAREEGKNIIVSFHDFSGTPKLDELREIVGTVLAPYPEGIICKVATMTQAPEDVETLRELLASEQGRLSVLGMGKWGPSTRIEFPMSGSVLTYGYIDKQSAPGQQSARELVDVLTRRMPEYAAARRSSSRSLWRVGHVS